jgi:hypothetical protein
MGRPQCNIQKRDVGEEITTHLADLDVPCSNGGLVSEEMPGAAQAETGSFFMSGMWPSSTFLLYNGRDLRVYV